MSPLAKLKHLIHENLVKPVLESHAPIPQAALGSAIGMFWGIAPVWMMCYGTGVYAAGLFSVRLPRLLGLAFKPDHHGTTLLWVFGHRLLVFWVHGDGYPPPQL